MPHHESGWDDSDLAALDAYDADDETLSVLLFTVTNPAGSVAVSAQIDGRIHRVELSSDVTRMTEAQLSAEIEVLAGLASREALAGQHALLVASMHELGHDRVATRGFLSRSLGLPSPEDVNAEKTRVFATRYADD